MKIRHAIRIVEGRQVWTGSRRCWFNPQTKEVIEVGPALHPDHGEVFQTEGDPVAHEKLAAIFPGVDFSDLTDPYADVSDVCEIPEVEDILSDDPRLLGIVLGWVCVNCDPNITSIPYIIGDDKQGALKCLRWLAQQHVTPWDHPDFRVEIYTLATGSWSFASFRYDNGRLLPP